MKTLTFEQLLKLPAGIVFVIPSGPLAEEIAIKGTTLPSGTGTRVQLFRHINGTGHEAVVDNVPFETVIERFDTDELDTLLVKLGESLYLYRGLDRNRQATDYMVAKSEAEVPRRADIPVDVWLDRTPMYFDDKKILSYVYMVLFFFRLPAVTRMAMRPWIDQFNLFVNYQGKRWKVTGASRMGDIQLASNLERENMAGYDERVMLDFDYDGNSAKFSNWSDVPNGSGIVATVDGTPTVNLEVTGFRYLMEAARKAPWLPPEYFENDILEDLRKLIESHYVKGPQLTDSDKERVRAQLHEINGAEALGEVDGEKTYCLSESQLFELIEKYNTLPRD